MVKRQAISPVIATVIIVAVTIAVAIAVAFWMTGIIGLFTGFEQLTIESIYAEPKGGWNITLTVSNRGTTPTSITNILLNGVDITACTGNVQINKTSIPSKLPLPLNPGETKTIIINIPSTASCGPTTFKSGLSVEVKLHSSGGKDYPKLVVLP